jgi:Tfp pilus assembly protein PilF
VAEWSIAHAWKACLPQGNQGSNPCPSAGAPPNFLAVAAAIRKNPFVRFAAMLSFFAAIAVADAAEPQPATTGSIDAAKAAFRANDVRAALSAIDQLESARGVTAESADWRGMIAMEQGKLDAAAQSFQRAHDLDPALFGPRLHLADLWLRQRNYPQAAKAYEPLLGETNVLTSSERVRYALLLVWLGAHDEPKAKKAFARIKFPTETPAYYCAQAAWEFAHGHEREAKAWLATAARMFNESEAAWFTRPLYEFGWLKQKPPAALP